MSTVSVVIPVFNTARYISRCLNSLKEQTFRDWEALCVDDGSTDGTTEIIERYTSEDNRFKLIRKTGGGVSAARNTALDAISGDGFLMFLDSDDFLHPQTMEICLRLARSDEADLVAFTYDRSYRTRETIRQALHLPFEAKPRTKQYGDKIRKIVTTDIFSFATEYSKPEGIEPRWAAVKHCQPWRCFYRFKAIKDIRFPEGIIYEDFPWWSEVLLNIRKAVIINLPLYRYYPNFKGFIHSSSQDFRIDSLRKAIEISARLYESKAGEEQKRNWEKNFLTPFREKLIKKERKLDNK